MCAPATVSFQDVVLTPISRDNQIWITSSELAKALQYDSEKSVSVIYSRHQDEFNDDMSSVIKLITQGQERQTRVFSPRGCHLVASIPSSTPEHSTKIPSGVIRPKGYKFGQVETELLQLKEEWQTFEKEVSSPFYKMYSRLRELHNKLLIQAVEAMSQPKGLVCMGPDALIKSMTLPADNASQHLTDAITSLRLALDLSLSLAVTQGK